MVWVLMAGYFMTENISIGVGECRQVINLLSPVYQRNDPSIFLQSFYHCCIINKARYLLIIMLLIKTISLTNHCSAPQKIWPIMSSKIETFLFGPT